jgi:hypothetical protein
MASILDVLRSLFGGSRASVDAEPAVAASIEYKGFVIRAAPYRDGDQYQTAGIVAKEVDGVMKEHRFVRADRYASLDDAVAFALAKGRQIVDEQERLPGRRGLFEE